MYDAPGHRIDVNYDGGADGKTAIRTNTFAVVDNKVLLLTKTTQPDRFTRPDSEEINHIEPNELCVGTLGGIHEVELTGALSGVSKGDKLWIDSENNAILTSGSGGTGGSPANEKQSVKIQATGGTMKWTVPAIDIDNSTLTTEQTAAISGTATAAQVLAAIEALPGVNAGDYKITGGPGDEAGTTPYVVEFIGRLADQDVAAITVDATALTGGEHKATITTTTAGAGSSDVALPLGVVDEIDATRNPHVARVNTNALAAFITS